MSRTGPDPSAARRRAGAHDRAGVGCVLVAAQSRTDRIRFRASSGAWRRPTAGRDADLDQAHYASIIVGLSVRRGLPARAASIAMATVYQETGIRNLDYGDRDSVGLFQQRPSQGWGTEKQLMDPLLLHGQVLRRSGQGRQTGGPTTSTTWRRRCSAAAIPRPIVIMKRCPGAGQRPDRALPRRLQLSRPDRRAGRPGRPGQIAAAQTSASWTSAPITTRHRQLDDHIEAENTADAWA